MGHGILFLYKESLAVKERKSYDDQNFLKMRRIFKTFKHLLEHICNKNMVLQKKKNTTVIHILSYMTFLF